MTLYSGFDCIHSHSCRIVLHEKEVECHIQYVDLEVNPEELAELNPYNETPTLVDRELVLYGSQIINEYLDERLPHPPLMPVDPVNRGRARLMIARLQRDWIALLEPGFNHGETIPAATLQTVRDGLIAVSPIFSEQRHMLGEEFSLVDCFLAPLLWRLPYYDIHLPRQAKPMLDYAQKVFERPAFKASLSEAEMEMQ